MKRERFWLPARPCTLRWPTCLIPFPGAYGYLDWKGPSPDGMEVFGHRGRRVLLPVALDYRPFVPGGMERAADDIARLFEGLSRAFQQDCRSTKPGEWASREGNPWTPRIREM